MTFRLMKILYLFLFSRFNPVALTAQTSGVTKEKQLEVMGMARLGDTAGVEDHLDHRVPVNLQVSECT